MTRATATLIVLAALTAPSVAAAQGISLQAGRLFDGEGLSSYQVGWATPLLGVLGTDIGGVMWRGPGVTERRLGLTADMSLFRGGRAGLYAVGGVGGGFGSGGAEDHWRSWSAGFGYELFPLSFMSLGVEGRWRELEPSRRSGIEFALRLGTLLTGPASPRPSMTASNLTASERGSTIARADAEGVLADVVRIAETQMGTPYEYGGTGRGDDGFDCSGLIQYAYAQAGIAVPRQSRDQARSGTAVARAESNLRPGDILTFAQSGRRITHVGLYIGDGRFIHSASKGVQISTLGTSDPNGRWWYKRWAGVRRIVSEP